MRASIAALAVILLLTSRAATAQGQQFEIVTPNEGPLPSGEASVSGRVIDADTGVPIAGARVTLRITFGSSPANHVTSDASGGFAFRGIAAGSYHLSATSAGYTERGALEGAPSLQIAVTERQRVEGTTFRLRRGAVLAGRIVDEFGDPVDKVTVYAQRIRYGSDGSRSPSSAGMPDTTDDLGRFRIFGLSPGDYLAVAAGRNARSDATGLLMFSPTWASATVPTYYPGTANAGQAQAVSLAPGQEAAIDFALSQARPVTVSGTVRTSAGAPAVGMNVSLRMSWSGGISSRGSGRTAAEGTFSITAVGPGDYSVDVSSPPGAPVFERGTTKIVVGAEDLADVQVALNAGAEVTGTVVFEEGASRPGTLQLQASPGDAELGLTQGSYSDVIGDDGRFVLRRVFDRVWLQPANSQWTATSVSVDGRELGEEPLELGERQRSLSGVRVTLSDRLTNLSGTVVDARGRPLAAHAVVVLRAEPSPLPASQRVRVLRSNSTGDFQVRGLRPGNYVAGVIGHLDPGDEFSPDVEDRLRMHGKRFSLGPGEPVILELGITSGL